MDFYLVNNDSEHARSLMLKMAGEKRKGEMIPCTKQEIDSFTNGDFVQVVSGANKDQLRLTEINPAACYLAVVDKGNVNIDDLMLLKKGGLKLSIVRTRHGH